MLQRTVTTCLALPLFVLILAAPASAQVSDFETTRMKSTGGAGVASLLMDESTILNPAPIAFFNSSALYYQRDSGDTEFTGDEPNRPTSSTKSSSDAFIVSDSKGGASGSISYIKQKEDGDKRRTIGFSLSSAVGKKSALGASYKLIKDEYTDESGLAREDDYKQAVFGVTHVISPSFSIGLVAVDPFREKPENTRAIVGFQYVFEDFVSLMLDTGADYNEKLGDTAELRAAAQLKIYDDFFLRFGGYTDKALGEKGSGVGIGWIQPRLVIEFAIKNSSFESNDVITQFEKEEKETSFSLAYRF